MGDPIRHTFGIQSDAPGAARGFSLTAPALPAPAGGEPAAYVIPLGPKTDGYAPNANVVVQANDASLDDYIEASVEQFGAAGFRLNGMVRAKVSGRDAVRFDYEGIRQGTAFRWLALAVADAGRIVLATCTARREDFERHEAGMRACLESFRLED
jgi:hypothetical protein